MVRESRSASRGLELANPALDVGLGIATLAGPK
jgi:hypothetical protein